MLDLANNLWGWQAADRTMVRADQWQALHDTFVMDRRELGLAEWFETHNPTAQAQIIARMAEAIRKGYWDASEQTRRELAERWRQLAAAGAGEVGAATTREFIERTAGGFGEAAAQAEGAAASGAGETVSGRVLEEVAPPPSGEPQPWLRLAAAVLPRAVRRRRRPAIRSQSSSDGKSLMNGLETSLYELTRLFLLPVLLLILAALAYAFVALGGFAMEAWQRRRGRYRSRLAAWQALHGGNSDDLELWIMQRLEWLRITSRSAPMLGLVATMIPMGPALLALTRNDAQGIGENLVVAFSAVILALVAASITFFILTVRRRWLLQELRAVERARRPADALPRTRRGGRPDPLDGQPDRPVPGGDRHPPDRHRAEPAQPVQPGQGGGGRESRRGGHAHAGQGRQGAEALPGQRRDRRRAGQPRRGDLPLGRRTDDLRAGERRGGRQVATRTAESWDFCPEFPDNGRFPFLLVLAVEVKVNFLDNLRLEARFDDFTVIADQPIRYKGDGSAPGPFDYFLASSALCAAYFVKLYRQTRNIPTDNIRLSQNNIVDPENRYRQIFKIQVELPADISEKDRQGILRSIDRCTVKKVVQTGPEFVIEEVDNLDADAQALLMPGTDAAGCTRIPGKDLPLEQTIANLSAILAGLGMKIEIASWRNIVPNVWSLHIRDAQSPMCFTNGKGASKESALASALGEFIERLNCNFFYNDQYWGEEIANAAFVHYPDERWFKPGRDDALPLGLLDGHCLAIYDPDGELRGSHLYDTNSGNVQRGICALPFVRQSDGQVVYFPPT